MAKLSPRDVSCSAPGWVSGGCTGHGIDGYRFEPFRVTGLPWPRMHQHGDHHGRLFPSVEAGSAFSLERGYSVVYRGPYAIARKVHRDKLKFISDGFIRICLPAVKTREDLVRIVDIYSGQVGFVTGDILARGHWWGGYWAAARKLRPDLFREGV